MSLKNDNLFIRFIKILFLLSILALVIYLLYLISNKIVKFTTKTDDYLSIANHLKGEDKPVNNLILFSNNAEQRLGGGFIGSVGLIRANKSKFDIEPIRSVYYYDKELIGKPPIESVPEELSGLTSIMALRDSAIYPNWPDSAKLAAKFFREEAGVSADNVISVTPEFLKEMLRIIGPITLNEYGKEINNENFLETVQLEVESGSDKKAGKDPKTILSVLADRLVHRLLNEDIGKISQYYDLIKRMIEEKQLVIYSFDSTIQQKLEKANMSAKLAQTDGNYLMVAGANIGANKSSPFVTQTIEQKIEIDDRGEAVVDLKITRKHNSDYKFFYFDKNMSENKWLIGENNQYQQVYLPYGSKLLKASIGETQIKQFTQNGKTVLAFNQLTIPGGTTSVELSYKLPFNYYLSNQFMVKNLFEKQVGSFNDKLIQIIKVPSNYHLKSANPNKYNYISDSEIEYNDILNSTKITEAIYAE